MTRLSVYILILSVFLLAACNEEKKAFMTPKKGVIVLDINAENFALNGMVLGKTATDISAIDDLQIVPLGNELQRIRRLEQEEALRNGQPADEGIAKLHIDENISYDVFYKSIATVGFNGYVSVQLVMGSDFNDIYEFNLPKRSSFAIYSCRRVLFRINEWKIWNQIPSRQNISYDAILDKYTSLTSYELECIRNNIGMNLNFVRKNDSLLYVVNLNESGLIDGAKTYMFEKDADLWRFIEDVRSKSELRAKDDNDEIVITSPKDVLMKDIVPIIKRLRGYSYKIVFTNFSVQF